MLAILIGSQKLIFWRACDLKLGVKMSFMYFALNFVYYGPLLAYTIYIFYISLSVVKLLEITRNQIIVAISAAILLTILISASLSPQYIFGQSHTFFSYYRSILWVLFISSAIWGVVAWFIIGEYNIRKKYHFNIITKNITKIKKLKEENKVKQ